MIDVLFLSVGFILFVALILPMGLRGYQKQIEYEKTSIFYKWFRIIGSISLFLYVVLEYVLKV